MNFLFAAAVLGLAGAFPLEGDEQHLSHSQPWKVHLGGCTGALISEWWVVTSFECTPIPYSTVVSLGDSASGVTEQRILVAETVVRDPYRTPHHSLTLARLAEPALLDEYVQPIPVAHRCPAPGEVCTVSSCRSTIPGNHENDEYLKCRDVSIVDDQSCMDTFPSDMFWDPNMVCAGRANSTYNCVNSGALLVCDGYLQGVQWFRLGCQDPENPNVFSKLCNYNSWINNVVDNYIPVQPTETTPLAPTP